MGALLFDGFEDATALAASSAKATAYAGMLTALLPPGKLWRIAGSVLSKLLLACADELGRLDGRVADMLNEADPSTALELLPEYERELDLVAAVTTAERRANIVARLVRRQKFRPVDFQQALAQLFGLSPADVLVIERTLAYVALVGDQRDLSYFFVFRDPALGGTWFLTSAQAVITAMAPSHTIGTAIESVACLYDDPYSLYDRDLLAAQPLFISASAPVVTRGTGLVVAAPAGTAAGDVVLALVWVANDPLATLLTASLPAGWSVLSSILTSGFRRAILLRRVATASEPATHTFPCTADGSSVVNGVCLAYRGLSTTAPVGAAGASEALATVSFISPTVTLTRVTDLYLGFAWGNNNTATSTAPAGTTERVNQSATQDGFTHVEVFDMQPGPGASGPETTTFSIVSSGVAAAYVLRGQYMAGA